MKPKKKIAENCLVGFDAVCCLVMGGLKKELKFKGAFVHEKFNDK